MIGKILTTQFAGDKYKVIGQHLSIDKIMIFEVKSVDYLNFKHSLFMSMKQLKDFFHISLADEVLYGK